MVSLAFALSFVKIWQMPLGGSITLASMLPILFIGIKYGPKIGLGTAFVYSLTQLAQGFIEGDISAVSMSLDVFIIAMLFDYVLPYVCLGISGIFGKEKRFAPYAGIVLAVFLRFICHFVTGVTIWEQWTPDGWHSWVYSLCYNGGYLLPDVAICLAVSVLMLDVKPIRKILGLCNK
jgi:thiamine transporter